MNCKYCGTQIDTSTDCGCGCDGEMVAKLQAQVAALTEAVLYANEWAEIGGIVRVPYDAWKKVVSQAALIQESE